MFAQNDAYVLGYLCGWIMSGFVIGLLPLLLGLARGQQGLAWGGFGACAAGGLFGAIFLAGPIAIVFTIIILVQPADAGRRRRSSRDYYDDDYDDRDSRGSRFRDDDRESRRYDDRDSGSGRRFRDEDRASRRYPEENDRTRSREEDDRRDRRRGKGSGYRESDDY